MNPHLIAECLMLLGLGVLGGCLVRSGRERRRLARQLALQDEAQRRQLELQHLAATIAELERLSSAVHEGIAQDLTGISLLLRTVAGSGPGDTEQLATINAHVGRVIARARELARSLSLAAAETGAGAGTDETPGPTRSGSGHAGAQTSPGPRSS